ncbi:hypothetical protein ABID56_002613 [Alkalibacillus flavidus]|uniref:Uncharacterized protein n=1 Tax=Alkalibacillus flavidus TaxID=546021 RepID=A0ABV2L0Y8_9BACI
MFIKIQSKYDEIKIDLVFNFNLVALLLYLIFG